MIVYDWRRDSSFSLFWKVLLENFLKNMFKKVQFLLRTLIEKPANQFFIWFYWRTFLNKHNRYPVSSQFTPDYDDQIHKIEFWTGFFLVHIFTAIFFGKIFYKKSRIRFCVHIKKFHKFHTFYWNSSEPFRHNWK